MKTQFKSIVCTYANNALDKINCDLSVYYDIEPFYKCESHRHFHTTKHINDMFIELQHLHEKENFKEDEFNTLVIAILFHDIIYKPWRTDNEEESAKFLKENADDCKIVNDAIEIILGSKKHDAHPNSLAGIFNRLDESIMYSTNIAELIEYEHQIFKEYQFTDLDIYIEKRCEFLSKYVERNPTIKFLIDYVRNRKYSIAIYPGSFNPFHAGHADILIRAEEMFDKVIIVKGRNPNKPYVPMQKLEFLESRQVIEYDKNIIKYFMADGPLAKYNPVLIRGLRNSSDLLYEENYITFCKELHPNLSYCFLLCSKEYSHISSSAIRELENTAPELYEKYIVK